MRRLFSKQEQKLKIRYCIIWRCLHLNVLNNKRFRKMKRARLWKNVILWAISRREILSLVVIKKKKKLIKLHGGQLDVTTNIYLKSCAYHADSAALVQNAAPSFMEVLAIRSPLKVHCYTCMSFKTCWSRRIYTKLSSHRSFVIKCTLSRCCISPWSFYRSLRRRREMDIFHEF